MNATNFIYRELDLSALDNFTIEPTVMTTTQSTTTSHHQSSAGSQEGMGAVAIASVALGLALVSIGLLLALVVCCWWHRHQNNPRQAQGATEMATVVPKPEPKPKPVGVVSGQVRGETATITIKKWSSFSFIMSNFIPVLYFLFNFNFFHLLSSLMPKLLKNNVQV